MYFSQQNVFDLRCQPDEISHSEKITRQYVKTTNDSRNKCLHHGESKLWKGKEVLSLVVEAEETQEDSQGGKLAMGVSVNQTYRGGPVALKYKVRCQALIKRDAGEPMVFLRSSTDQSGAEERVPEQEA